MFHNSCKKCGRIVGFKQHICLPFTQEHKRKLKESAEKAGTLFKKGHKPFIVAKEKNGRWNNGSSFAPYTSDWIDDLRDSIRKRDDYTCIFCGIHQDELCKKLDIHHIDYNKENCNPSNLITLCRSCHMKTNASRNYWIEYFN